MNRDVESSLAWIRTGGICGLLGVASYLAAAFAPLPDVAAYAAAFAFGPLLAIGLAGARHLLALERPGPLVDIAALFGVAAGFTVLLMLTVQQAIFGLTGRAIARAGETPDAEVLRRVREGLNSVHLGIDVAWDVLIATAVVLSGIAMLRHRRFGRVFGGLGVALGALLLGFNLWYFPTPPADAGSIDWGPFVALWALAVFVQQLRSRRWARARLDERRPAPGWSASGVPPR
jgi:hypothetical protein